MKKFIVRTTSGDRWEICPTSYVVEAVSEFVAREEVKKIDNDEIVDVEEIDHTKNVTMVQSFIVE